MLSSRHSDELLPSKSLDLLRQQLGLLVAVAQCFVDPMEMMAWWKAVVPGEFRMGSEEYWESAQRGEETLPPQDGQLSGNDLLHMDKLMPGWAKLMPASPTASPTGSRPSSGRR